MEFAYIIGNNVSTSRARLASPRCDTLPRSGANFSGCYSRGEHAGEIILLQTRAIEQTYLSIDLARANFYDFLFPSHLRKIQAVFLGRSVPLLPARCRLYKIYATHHFSHWEIHPSSWHHSKSYLIVLNVATVFLRFVATDRLHKSRKDRSGFVRRGANGAQCYRKDGSICRNELEFSETTISRRETNWDVQRQNSV